MFEKNYIQRNNVLKGFNVGFSLEIKLKVSNVKNYLFFICILLLFFLPKLFYFFANNYKLLENIFSSAFYFQDGLSNDDEEFTKSKFNLLKLQKLYTEKVPKAVKGKSIFCFVKYY